MPGNDISQASPEKFQVMAHVETFAKIMHNSQNYLVFTWMICMLRICHFFLLPKAHLSLGLLILYSVQLWIQWLLIVLLQKRFAEITLLKIYTKAFSGKWVVICYWWQKWICLKLSWVLRTIEYENAKCNVHCLHCSFLGIERAPSIGFLCLQNAANFSQNKGNLEVWVAWHKMN